MADSAVAITAGTGTAVDTRTESTNGNHRQVVVLGDPASNAGVAPVDATNGLSVNIMSAATAGLSLDTSIQTLITNSAAAIPAGSNLIGGVNGPIASGQTGATTNPFRIGYQVRTSNVSTKTSGVVADSICTAVGALVIKSFSIPELDWAFASASGGIVNTSDTALVAAAGAGIKNYLTSIDISNAHATVATEVVIKDGSTVIWRGFFAAANVGSRSIEFASPLKTTANTALNVACITTGAAVYVNAQGYQAP